MYQSHCKQVIAIKMLLLFMLLSFIAFKKKLNEEKFLFLFEYFCVIVS